MSVQGGRLRRSRTHFAVVVLCLALSYVLGVSNLKSYPIVEAEFNSIKHLWSSQSGPTNSIPETVESVFTYSSDHAPGYMILLNLWSRLTGRDLFTLRLLSVFFSLFALVLTYRLALLTRSADTATVAALIVASLAFIVYYSYTVRMYSLLAMSSAWVAWSYWKITSIGDPVPRRYGMNFILAASVILWVHYFGLIVLAAVGFYHIFFVRKTRRWIQICLALMAAGLLFLPLLPYFLAGTAGRSVPWRDALSLVDAALAIASIYTNGLPFLVPVVGIAAAVNYRRLGEFQKYILILACLIVLLMLVANEIAPLLIARRIRYTIIFALPWACALAIGLNLVPAWRLFRIPFLILWIAAFAAYSKSDELLLYTNWLTQNQHKVPHYQDFLYEPAVVTRKSDYIVSFHQGTPINPRILRYYGAFSGRWSGLIHIWTNNDGEAEILSSNSRFNSLESTASWRFPAWLIYNPEQTDLRSIYAYTNGFAKHFKLCGRYVEKRQSVIERYAPNDIPCALLISATPLAVRYDSGTELVGAIHEIDADILKVHTSWMGTDVGVYSYSLQVFDQDESKVGPQADEIIGSSGLYTQSLNVSSLPDGEYVVKLILYDRLSLESQSGRIMGANERFEREVDIARFSIAS